MQIDAARQKKLYACGTPLTDALSALTHLWGSPVPTLFDPVAVALLAFGRLGMGLTYLVFISALGLSYEWTHYLIHSDYKPKTRVYRAIWRNHRQHHCGAGSALPIHLH